MSFTPMATRSMPTVSWRPARQATFSLDPTPSVDETMTGSRYFDGRPTRLAKPPTPPITSARFVARASGMMRRTASSPASMSTPASRYVSGFTSALEEAELWRRLGRDTHAVVAGEARVAELPGVRAGRLEHAVERKIAERVGAEVATDLLGAVARADQLLARRRVDAVVAGPLDRRRRDPHVDLLGAGGADHSHDLPARRSPHDGIVDDHHAPVAQHLAHRVELHLDAEVADALLGLDERAPDVVIANQPHPVRRPRLLGVAERRARARVRHGDDDVGMDGILTRELSSQRLAYGVDVAAPEDRVRPGEVDVLENAVQPLARREGSHRPGARVRDDQDLPRLDVALALGFHQVERARLRGDHVGIAESSERQWTEAIGVADRVQRVEGHDEERVGALDLPERVGELLLQRPRRRARQQMQDHLGVGI